ncbi:MAG: N-acetyl-glucosamine-6-phosphate deacetylase [Bogoriella megaspora]|nr:MAG: N-acetyl-glucosamine-6-phosphate deacetylase [Bogoriella megaspora]
MKFINAVVACAPAVSALWPIPATYNHGDTALFLDDSVKVTYNGQEVDLHAASVTSFAAPAKYGTTNSSSVTSAQIVGTAVQRTYQTVLNQSYVPWQFHPRNAKFEPTANGSSITSIQLVQNATDPKDVGKPLTGSVDESYTLDLSTSGNVVISAKSSIGLARGLTTFTQLFYKSSNGGFYTPLAPVSIVDSPKFPYRGLHMDVSRSYYPVKDILRQLDAAAYSKLNRFHLHATDAQAWPLYITSKPELTDLGAYEKNLIYSASDLTDIQEYGALIGVEVIVEIDSPGHTSSVWFSNPDLIAAFNQQPSWDTYAAEPPSGTLKLNSTAVYDFLNEVYDDLLPRLNPYTSYFHTGGDEVNLNAYLLDDTVRSNDTAVLQPLMQKFVDRNHNQVRANGLHPLVWEEMLLTWNLTLGSDVVVHAWDSVEGSVGKVTALGHKVVSSNYQFWYLDCGQGQWLDFYPNVSASWWPFPDYCSPRKNWRLVYSYDPLANIPANETHLVLGGVVAIWSEQTDPINLDRQVWPRAAAAAEVLWSGAKDPVTGQNRSQVEASPRLADHRERLVARGVQAEPVHMVFCTQNGTQCGEIHSK